MGYFTKFNESYRALDWSLLVVFIVVISVHLLSFVLKAIFVSFKIDCALPSFNAESAVSFHCLPLLVFSFNIEIYTFYNVY